MTARSNYIPQLLKSGFVKNVATLMAGNTGAMAISVLAAPIISRLFIPADFGVAALFVTICMLAGSIAALNFERAILLPKEESVAAKLISLSIRSLLTFALLALIILFLLWSLDLPLPFGTALGKWVWVLPLGIVLVSMRSILATVLTRAKRFRTLSITEFSQGLLTTSGRISSGAIWGTSISGLIGGFLLGFTVYLGLLAKNWHRVSQFLRTRHSWAELKEVAIEYKDFPLFSMPSTFVTRFSSRLPILVIGVIFAPQIVGFYAMADRLIRAPVMAAGGAIRRVYMQRTAGFVNSGQSLRGPFLKTTIGLAALGLIPFGILGFFGTDLLRFVLGERWAPAGAYVEILAPWYYAVWIGSISQSTMIVLRRQSLWFWLQVGVAAIRVTVFAVTYLLDSPIIVMLTAFATVNVFLSAGLLVIASRLVWKMPNE